MWMTALGTAMGLPLALALTRAMRSLLFEIAPADPLTFIFVALLFAAAAFLACYIPARRATRVDLLSALRHE